jgi:hypothetical protein
MSSLIALTITTKQLANFLHCNYKQAYRTAKALNFIITKKNHRIYYNFTKLHPFYKSIVYIRNNSLPVYSLHQIANLWCWKKGNYTTKAVSIRLDNLDVPIYNKSKKGYVYLIDLIKLKEEPE